MLLKCLEELEIPKVKFLKSTLLWENRGSVHRDATAGCPRYYEPLVEVRDAGENDYIIPLWRFDRALSIPKALEAFDAGH
ncbi:hypothetical protein BS47DRAFT_1346118 [Hydnum rufescens UP504]|uniref:Uncharacterized protein n=1 Tax=Hydnum rufescens UP504 TaxID=1448309 RepID=A0A9P6DUS7_9AGAM|nr:hypothetical protein BS47DRAFT_1346118 [Hydnum rufescens UP504]